MSFWVARWWSELQSQTWQLQNQLTSSSCSEPPEHSNNAVNS